MNDIRNQVKEGGKWGDLHLRLGKSKSGVGLNLLGLDWKLRFFSRNLYRNWRDEWYFWGEERKSRVPKTGNWEVRAEIEESYVSQRLAVNFFGLIN